MWARLFGYAFIFSNTSIIKCEGDAFFVARRRKLAENTTHKIKNPVKDPFAPSILYPKPLFLYQFLRKISVRIAFMMQNSIDVDSEICDAALTLFLSLNENNVSASPRGGHDEVRTGKLMRQAQWRCHCIIRIYSHTFCDLFYSLLRRDSRKLASFYVRKHTIIRTASVVLQPHVRGPMLYISTRIMMRAPFRGKTSYIGNT